MAGPGAGLEASAVTLQGRALAEIGPQSTRHTFSMLVPPG